MSLFARVDGVSFQRGGRMAAILQVIADEPLSGALAGLLTAAGHHVARARCRAEAEHTLVSVSASVQLAIIQRELPDGDGIDLIELLRSRGPIPFFVTARASSPEYEFEAYSRGAAGFATIESEADLVAVQIHALMRGSFAGCFTDTAL